MDGLPFSVDLHHVPKPSASFFLKQKDEDIYQSHKPKHNPQDQHENHKHKHMAPSTHKEYSLFRRGIFPDWEDVHCQHGGCFYTRHYWSPDVLDRFWCNLVAAVVNSDTTTTTTTVADETTTKPQLDTTHIVGIRIDDKSKSNHPIYKIEIWLNTTDMHVREHVRSQIMTVLLFQQNNGKDNNVEEPQTAASAAPPAPPQLKLHWRPFGEGGGSKNSVLVSSPSTEGDGVVVSAC
jgi:hypothetical protein